jgi:hypothetical protein
MFFDEVAMGERFARGSWNVYRNEISRHSFHEKIESSGMT